MTRRLRLLVALAVLALTAAPGSASALVATNAKFKATLSGTQLESSTVPATQFCPAVQTKENLGFRARGPFRVEITFRGSETFVGQTNLVRVSTTGSVTRQKNAVGCSDQDDRDKPLDCGTRHFPRWRLELQAFERSLNLLENPNERSDLFGNCSPIGIHFPEVLAPEEKPVVAHVPKSRILNRHIKTIVLSAHRTVTERLDRGGSTRTTLRWTLKLTRR